MSISSVSSSPTPSKPAASRKLRLISLLPAIALLALVLAACTPGNVIGVAEGWTPVTAVDGVVYTGTRDGNVLALNAQEMDKDERIGPIWEYKPREENRLGSIFGSPAVSDTHVYLSSAHTDEETGRLLALSRNRQPDNRSQLQQDEWEKTIEGALVGGPVLAGSRLLVGSEDGRLYCFDAVSGDRLWTFQTQGLLMGLGKERRIWSTPAIANGVAYFGAMDGYMYAVSVESGNEVWKFKTEGAIVTNPLVVGNAVIFGSFDRTLYALDASNAAVLWTYSSDGWWWAGPVSDGETVYAADMGGQVLALPLDRRDGDPPLWTHEIGYIVNATPAIVDDKLVVAAKSGVVSILDLDTGTAEEVPLDLEKDIRASLAASGSGELARVYFGDVDGVVRSLDVDRWRVSWTLETRE